MDGRLNEFVIGFYWQTQRNARTRFEYKGEKTNMSSFHLSGHTADVFLITYLNLSL